MSGDLRVLVPPIKSSSTPMEPMECVAVENATICCGKRTSAAIASSLKLVNSFKIYLLDNS